MSARLRFARTSDPAHGDAASVTVRVSELKAAAGAPTGALPQQAPDGPSTGAAPSADIATTTTPVSEEEDADAPEGPSEAPAAPALEGTEPDTASDSMTADDDQPADENNPVDEPADNPVSDDRAPELAPANDHPTC
jgi:hypothetical protein